MNIVMTGRHIRITNALREYVQQKVERLGRYSLPLSSVQMILSVEKFRHQAEIVCVFNGKQYRAKSSSPEMYASIDNVTDKIDRQMRKTKDKLVSHKGTRRRQTLARMPSKDGERPGVSVGRTRAETLTIHEAIGRLPVEAASLFFFKEAASGSVLALRRGAGGTVEVIVPQGEPELA
ncbi:MAG: ribosome-associated translation inhibitor RaiA [Nitrospiraceae bacterium]